MLLAAGAEKDAINKNGATIITVASLGGHLQVVEMLLKSGAETDTSDRQGYTPLSAAAYGCKISVTPLYHSTSRIGSSSFTSIVYDTASTSSYSR